MKTLNLFTNTFNFDGIEKYELIHGSDKLMNLMLETFSEDKTEQIMKHYGGWIGNRGLISPDYKEYKVFGDLKEIKEFSLAGSNGKQNIQEDISRQT